MDCEQWIVRVISKRHLMEIATQFSDCRTVLKAWLNTVQQAKWSSLEELRQTYPATDMVGRLAIFNIKGNRYRLIVRMEFSEQRIFVKEFLTHAEYNKGAWKKWL